MDGVEGGGGGRGCGGGGGGSWGGEGRERWWGQRLAFAERHELVVGGHDLAWEHGRVASRERWRGGLRDGALHFRKHLFENSQAQLLPDLAGLRQ